MSFRERPEYQEWRDAVFKLFGRKCILCGHEGNIHAHHILPVNTYPESVFEPTNGVPLCGNCHSEVNGDEPAYVDDLKRRQQAIMNGESVEADGREVSEKELRALAESDPTNAKAVSDWFAQANDPQVVIDFYNAHRASIPKTARLYRALAGRLRELGRWNDVVRVVDGAMRCAEKEGTLGETVGVLAWWKSDALCKLSMVHDAIEYLRGAVTRFTDNAELHRTLSNVLYQTVDIHNPDKGVMQEVVRHAVLAASLAATNGGAAGWAAFVSKVAGDYKAALRYGEQALSLASTSEDKIDALSGIAQTFMRNDLYSNARGYLRKALQIDEQNVDVIVDLAHCFYMEENLREASRMAQMGLMLDPNNESCRRILDDCGESLR
jgi:tetratricopeptide (TPR) repeat protein